MLIFFIYISPNIFTRLCSRSSYSEALSNKNMTLTVSNMAV